MVQELQDIFPKFNQFKIWKILLTIKSRYEKYGVIGISRLEATRFGTSERQLQAFIKYLREVGAITKKRMVKGWNNVFKCNVYTVSGWFIDGLKEIRGYVKKKDYIDPIEFVKSRFTYKIKYNKLKFEANGDKYIIHLRGRFKGKIFDPINNCIINPLNLGKIF